VGLALPAWNALSQGGVALPAVLVDMLPAFVVLSLGSALASGLSDENSDRAGGKRTFTTLLGNPAVRRAIEGCVLVAALLFVGAPWATRLLAATPEGSPAPALVSGGVGAVAALVALVRMRAVTPPPATDVFPSQALFKERLHGAIWYGSLAVLLTRALMTETV
jgi:4-hydroxybenzoate polyprenyltransferase